MIDMKAILVLDKMPKSCSECPALRWSDLFCDASGVVPTLIEDIFGRPVCCPLKEADYFTDIEKWEKDEYKGGWNDAMLQIGAITIEQAMPWMKED